MYKAEIIKMIGLVLLAIILSFIFMVTIVSFFMYQNHGDILFIIGSAEFLAWMYVFFAIDEKLTDIIRGRR